MKKKVTSRRTRLINASGSHFIRRRKDGTIKREVAIGKSLAADRRQKAKRRVPKGQGDKGDQRR